MLCGTSITDLAVGRRRPAGDRGRRIRPAVVKEETTDVRILEAGLWIQDELVDQEVSEHAPIAMAAAEASRQASRQAGRQAEEGGEGE